MGYDQRKSSNNGVNITEPQSMLHRYLHNYQSMQLYELARVTRKCAQFRSARWPLAPILLPIKNYASSMMNFALLV